MPRKRHFTRQQKILDKMAAIKRELQADGIKVKGEIQYRTDGPNKLSQAILDFIEPYKKEFSPLNTPRYSALIGIACAAWNAALLEEPERRYMLDEVCEAIFTNADLKTRMELRQLTHELIERKLTYFPDDRRYVVSYELTETKNNYHLAVMTLLHKP